MRRYVNIDLLMRPRWACCCWIVEGCSPRTQWPGHDCKWIVEWSKTSITHFSFLFDIVLSIGENDNQTLYEHVCHRWGALDSCFRHTNKLYTNIHPLRQLLRGTLTTLIKNRIEQGSVSIKFELVYDAMLAGANHMKGHVTSLWKWHE